jgi:hypothetical protein
MKAKLASDDDLNAARNLAALVGAAEVSGRESSTIVVAGSGPETENARGGDVRPGTVGRSPRKREASGPGRDGAQDWHRRAARLGCLDQTLIVQLAPAG